MKETEDFIFISKKTATEMIEEISSLRMEVQGLNARFSIFSLHSCKPQYLKISDICHILNISRTDLLQNKKYLLPDFGTHLGNEKYKCKAEDFYSWLLIPLEEKKKRYQQYLVKEKKRYLEGTISNV